MKCVICKTGEVTDDKTTVTLQRGECTVVIKDVPARICSQCEEYYLSEEMAGKVLEMAEDAIGKGAEVEIRRWAA